MSLIRCPGCRLDTSDSLAHCPSCGRSLGGSGPRLFDHRPAAVEEASKPSVLGPVTAPSPRPGAAPKPRGTPGTGKLVTGIGLLIGLLVLTLLPAFVPLVVGAVIVWFFAKRQKRTGPQIEALKIFVNEVSRARTTASKERPLDMLRRIEEELKNKRRA